MAPAALGTLALFAIHVMINVPLSLGAGLFRGLSAAMGESAQWLVAIITIFVQMGLAVVGQVTSALLLVGLVGVAHAVKTGAVEVVDSAARCHHPARRPCAAVDLVIAIGFLLHHPWNHSDAGTDPVALAQWWWKTWDLWIP